MYKIVQLIKQHHKPKNGLLRFKQFLKIFTLTFLKQIAISGLLLF